MKKELIFKFSMIEDSEYFIIQECNETLIKIDNMTLTLSSTDIYDKIFDCIEYQTDITIENYIDENSSTELKKRQRVIFDTVNDLIKSISEEINTLLPKYEIEN